jgi:hypothetical protein
MGVLKNMLYKVSEGTAARRRVYVGPLVDATDGFSLETGEAAGQPQISKNGGAFGNTAATLVALASGLYYVELSAAELDTVGKIALRYKSAATREFQVVHEVVGFDPYTAGSVPATAAEVWANATRTLTQSAAQVSATVAGQTIEVFRGDTFVIALTGLGDITGYTTLWMTVKPQGTDVEDAVSTLQVEVDAAGPVTQLNYLNGGAAGTPSDGSIVVNAEATGDITVTVKPNSTKVLTPGSYVYDVQVLDSTVVTTLTSGTFVISTDTTRAVA